MESHRVPAAGFTPPVDSSDEAKTHDALSTKTGDQTIFYGPTHHSSVCHTATPDDRSKVEEVSHWVTRRRREESTGDLEKGKLIRWLTSALKADLLRFSLSKTHRSSKIAASWSLWPFKSPEIPDEPEQQVFRLKEKTKGRRQKRKEEKG